MERLGTLEPVDLRAYWADEAHDFTPWLASEQGLALLGKTIGMELELVGQEQRVGPFKADVLARDTGQDEENYVIIENQLEKTNHDHLGKIITYSAGFQALTVIWIAEAFTDEHRKALDWLNENVGENLSFFGLQIELWKIGASSPAPQFKIISRPNIWAKAARQSGSQASKAENLDQLKFWEEVQEYARHQKSRLRFSPPRPWPGCNVYFGRSGFHLNLRLLPASNKIRCRFEINLGEESGGNAFEFFESQKQVIENKIGTKLEWKQEAGQIRRHITAFKEKITIEDTQQRERAVAWFNEMAEKFHAALAPLVKSWNYTGDD